MKMYFCDACSARVAEEHLEYRSDPHLSEETYLALCAVAGKKPKARKPYHRKWVWQRTGSQQIARGPLHEETVMEYFIHVTMSSK